MLRTQLVEPRPSLAPSQTVELITDLKAPLAGVIDNCLGEHIDLVADGAKKTYSGSYSDDRYDLECSFVVSSNDGVNCSSIYKNFIKNLNCVFIAKLDVDKTWLESIQFDKVEFCWGKIEGKISEVITVKYDWWNLKQIEKCNFIIDTRPTHWITTLDHHNAFRYIMVPWHMNKISLSSKRMGSMMAILNTSPWYMVQLMKLPHDPIFKSAWNIAFKTGRYPFVIKSKTKNKKVQYLRKLVKSSCTRVYSEEYTFCIEAYNTSGVTEIDMLPKRYTIESADYDLFQIFHYEGPDHSFHITDFFDKIFNHTAGEISEVFKKFSNITFDPADIFLKHVLIPTENYLISLFARLLKSILSLISDWLDFVVEEYLAIFVSIDCDYMLIEILLIVFVFFYYFPAYIATGIFTSILVMLIGIKRSYISFSPIDLTITTINYFANKTFFHYCNDTDCYYLYDLKCTGDR